MTNGNRRIVHKNVTNGNSGGLHGSQNVGSKMKSPSTKLRQIVRDGSDITMTLPSLEENGPSSTRNSKTISKNG